MHRQRTTEFVEYFATDIAVLVVVCCRCAWVFTAGQWWRVLWVRRCLDIVCLVILSTLRQEWRVIVCLPRFTAVRPLTSTIAFSKITIMLLHYLLLNVGLSNANRFNHVLFIHMPLRIFNVHHLRNTVVFHGVAGVYAMRVTLSNAEEK